MSEKKLENTVQEATAGQGAVNQLPEGGKILWLDREMQSSYANVVNVAASADEFMLLFGTSEAWNNVQKDIKVNLSERIIMTHNTAKRLQILLNKTMEEYEKRQVASKQ